MRTRGWGGGTGVWGGGGGAVALPHKQYNTFVGTTRRNDTYVAKIVFYVPSNTKKLTLGLAILQPHKYPFVGASVSIV